MSRVYDNWERLVGAVLNREELRYLARCSSLTSGSDFSFRSDSTGLISPPVPFGPAADDDPLPGIEGLQISGEAFPGQQLQAFGYSINGTISCNFEWVRHLEDGSFNYIDGAKQPIYLVTADDVDTYLAIEVQPLDDRKRKGELVKVFANEHRKITCAADDDPLPRIEGLQISGEAFPGQQLQACGYSINGTTSCNFEWVRHLEDGSFKYVDGAKQPIYLVTADDVDTYLAIEVQPLDDMKRKGELVKVFANVHRKITCDPEMLNCIKKTLYAGHASHKLSLSTGYLDIWEPATLSIKRDGYSIKCSGPSGVVVTEKFSPTTIVSIPYGSPAEFSVVDSQGVERILRVESSSMDITSSRDTIVLTLRVFILKADEKKKGRRSLFFKS